MIKLASYLASQPRRDSCPNIYIRTRLQYRHIFPFKKLCFLSMWSTVLVQMAQSLVGPCNRIRLCVLTCYSRYCIHWLRMRLTAYTPLYGVKATYVNNLKLLPILTFVGTTRVQRATRVVVVFIYFFCCCCDIFLTFSIFFKHSDWFDQYISFCSIVFR